MRSTRPDACSVASLDLHEPLAGTASTTGGYLLLEHGGPWGRKAMEEAAFPDPGGVPSDLGRWLAGASKSAGLTPLLVRRHGGTPGLPARPVVMLVALGGSAGNAPQGSVGLRGFGAWTQVDDVETIRHWDVDTLAAQLRAGRVPHDWSALATQYLVCTHGRRDVCCAELGRPVASVLDGLALRQVWEVSHLGGHRLAPNVLVVPDGVVYGRVDPDDALELVAAHAEHRVVPRLMRGHAVLPAALQVSEVALRQATGVDRADGVLLVDSASAPVVEGLPAADVDAVELASADGDVVRTTAHWADLGAGSGAWLTIVDSRPGRGPTRPASCGAEPGPPPEEHVVVEVSDVEAAGRGAAGWDEAHRSAAGVGEPSDVVVEILSMLPVRGTAVDVACGTGRHSFWLAKHGWQVTGVDYSRAGLRLAEREAARRGLSVTWQLADARVWSPPRPFDLVLMAFVHLPGAVRHAIEWVAPGGHLVLVAHARRNLTDGVGGPSDARLLYDPTELRAAAKDAGFEVLRCEEVERRTGDGTAIDVVLVARRGPKVQQVPVSGPAAARTTR
ncbi:MAG TPA: sucrase ferredoxin [Actinomycetales bacterium]|nr:sucrase ferredoxin [Actinomycetales bacterium]